MKTHTKLKKNQFVLPIGFGWHTGSKPSVKKGIKLSTKNINKVYST